MILVLNKLNMKGLIILLFIISIFVSHQLCYSQAGSSLGIKAGAGVSRYFLLVAADQEQILQNFVPVFQTGLVFSQLNEKNLGIQIELNYVQKAWEEKLPETGKYNVLFDNIELPVLTHLRIGKKKSAWLINLGLHVSYAFNARIDSSGVFTTTSIIEYNNLNYSNFDYGMDGGFGFEIGKERGIFQIQLMYSQGMKNILERDPEKVYRSLNQNLFLSCIYKIPLFRKPVKLE